MAISTDAHTVHTHAHAREHAHISTLAYSRARAPIVHELSHPAPELLALLGTLMGPNVRQEFLAHRTGDAVCEVHDTGGVRHEDRPRHTLCDGYGLADKHGPSGNDETAGQRRDGPQTFHHP